MQTRNWFLGLACATTLQIAAPQAHAGIFGLSEKDEIAAGKQVAQQALKEYGGALPYNDPMSVRARALGAQFARLSTRKNIPYSYTVLNNNKVLNAFAAPGGPIFVTRKLMVTAANDAELAYVLGHETAHIEQRHISKQYEQQQKAGLAVGILGAILGGKGGNVVGAAANVGWAVISSGYSRKDENEADAVGARWMSQLGYDPRAAVSMLGKLGSGSGGGLDKYLATHPAPKDRQTRVTQQIASEKLLQVAQQHGGPKLGSNLNYSSSAYYPNANDDGNSYPDSSDPAGQPAYYPPSDNGNNGGNSSPSYYPSDDTSDDINRELNFGAPLRLRAIERGDSAVVMSPVYGFARWAGATVATRDTLVTMRRGDFTLQLRRNSTVATLNGRTVTMSAPAVLQNGVLYAPLGHLAAGVGARATLDQGARLVRLSLAGVQGGFVRLP